MDAIIPLKVETDATEYVIAATLSRIGQHVAVFFSRNLSKSEYNDSTV